MAALGVAAVRPQRYLQPCGDPSEWQRHRRWRRDNDPTRSEWLCALPPRNISAQCPQGVSLVCPKFMLFYTSAHVPFACGTAHRMGSEMSNEASFLSRGPLALDLRTHIGAAQGAVLLHEALRPRTVWEFEAVMVLLSGHWPARGLLSGGPPCYVSGIATLQRPPLPCSFILGSGPAAAL